MLVQWLGDQALVFNDVLKYSMLTTRMVTCEYRRLRRVNQFKCQMKSNCPDYRLNIDGKPVTIH